MLYVMFQVHHRDTHWEMLVIDKSSSQPDTHIYRLLGQRLTLSLVTRRSLMFSTERFVTPCFVRTCQFHTELNCCVKAVDDFR